MYLSYEIDLTLPLKVRYQTICHERLQWCVTWCSLTHTVGIPQKFLYLPFLVGWARTARAPLFIALHFSSSRPQLWLYLELLRHQLFQCELSSYLFRINTVHMRVQKKEEHSLVFVSFSCSTSTFTTYYTWFMHICFVFFILVEIILFLITPFKRGFFHPSNNENKAVGQCLPRLSCHAIRLLSNQIAATLPYLSATAGHFRCSVPLNSTQIPVSICSNHS